jgi:hypothetical protein
MGISLRCGASAIRRDQVEIHDENKLINKCNNVFSVGNIRCGASDVIKLKFMTNIISLLLYVHVHNGMVIFYHPFWGNLTKSTTPLSREKNILPP